MARWAGWSPVLGDWPRRFSDNEVIAVLATATPRDALSEAEVEKAARDGVVVLAREGLRELWAAAQAGEISDQVVRRLRQLLVGAGSRANSMTVPRRICG